ncbi:MAG TPA: hypothetical protein VNM90_24170, partial [Haliangium sp.]|nr:hypothetical protein [Haliangium sp.]
TVALVKDAHFRSGLFQDATPALEQFLARHGRQSQGWLFNKNLRYREGVIEAGELVAVCGQGRREGAPAPRLALVASPSMPLYVSDDMATMR